MDNLSNTALPALLVSVRDAARLLGVSRDTVYRLFITGELRKVQMGLDRSLIRVRVSEVYAVIETRTL
jgi:excisionase family DNA binding protein